MNDGFCQARMQEDFYLYHLLPFLGLIASPYGLSFTQGKGQSEWRGFGIKKAKRAFFLHGTKQTKHGIFGSKKGRKTFFL